MSALLRIGSDLTVRWHFDILKLPVEKAEILDICSLAFIVLDYIDSCLTI